MNNIRWDYPEKYYRWSSKGNVSDIRTMPLDYFLNCIKFLIKNNRYHGRQQLVFDEVKRKRLCANEGGRILFGEDMKNENDGNSQKTM